MPPCPSRAQTPADDWRNPLPPWYNARPATLWGVDEKTPLYVGYSRSKYLPKMKFSLRAPFAVMTLTAIFAGALVYDRQWMWDMAVIGGYFLISVSLAFPFFCTASSRPFWTGYALTAAVFLALVITENDCLVRRTQDIAFLVAQGGRPIESGEEMPYLARKSLQIHDLIILSCAPFFGAISGAISQALNLRRTASNEGDL